MKRHCLYSNKINIYQNTLFEPLPVKRSPLPPPCVIYQPLTVCNQPYQTPTYYPSNSTGTSCTSCKICTCKK